MRTVLCTLFWRVLLGTALALSAGAAAAATFRGVVSHVTDGDTLWVRPAGGGAPVEIRLLNLDAPEGCQRFGREAKQALTRRLLHQAVTVRTDGRDEYDRSLAQVRHKGHDIGAWLVQGGFAWSNGPRGRPGPYERLEQKARQARKGLWAHPVPQEPRSFRRSHGRCL